MKYEFKGKSLAEATAKAVRAHKAPERKQSHRLSAGGGSYDWYQISLHVQPHRTYTVSWDASKPSDEDDYAIDISTDVGLGSYDEEFSSSGEWDFNSRGYEGEVTLTVGVSYAYHSFRSVYVSVF